MDLTIILLIIYTLSMGLLMIGIDKSYRTTQEGFMVSNRTAKPWQVGLSASAGWMYILGFLLTGKFAYELGPAGIFWFTLVYVGVLILFGYVGRTLVEKMPKGYTLNEYISQRYKDKKMTIFYQTLQIAAAIYAVTANLTGFGMISEYISQNFNYNAIIITIGITVLIYTTWGGIRASHKTDALQFGLLTLVCMTFGLTAILAGGGFDNVFENWNTAVPKGFFDKDLLLRFPGLLFLLFSASILADNMQYQNALSLGDKNKVVKSYWLGGLFLIMVMAGMAALSASAYSLPITVQNSIMAPVYVIETVMGPYGLWLFMLLILFKCSSVIDSALNGAGTIVAKDIIKNDNPILTSKITMAFIMISAILLTLMKIDLWILLTTFGALRILALTPTIYGVFCSKVIKTNLLFYTLLITGVIAFGLMSYNVPIDRFVLSLIIFLIPTSVIVYQHYKK